MRTSQKLLILIFLLASSGWSGSGLAQLLEDNAGWNEEAAMAHSQQAIGRELGNFRFTRSDGSEVGLDQYGGKPLIVSFIFTSCHHVCPATTRRLRDAIRSAREVMDDDGFQVLTIGFDTVNDTPDAMRYFAAQQSVNDVNWDFLSGDFETVDALAKNLGFIYYRSPRGFDHITQVSLIDADGKVYQQVYGMQFELPWLVEPLKELVFGKSGHGAGPIAGLLGRIQLFCTVYDPANDRYYFDYSLFIQIAIGFFAILGIGLFLFRGLRRPGNS